MKKILKSFAQINKYLYFALGFIAIFSIGLVFTARTEQVKEQEIKSRMLILTENFASVLDSKKFETLQSNLADEKSQDYIDIRTKLLELGRINKFFGIRWIYTMVPVDGRIVFSVDSIPNNSPSHSPPGDVYTDASEDMILGVENAWTRQIPSITSPYDDRWGSFITTIVPVVDDTTGKTVSVLASDMDYNIFFKQEVNKSIALPVIFTVFAEIIFSAIFFYIIYLLRDKRDLLGKNIVLKQYVEHVPGVFFQYQQLPDGKIMIPFTSRRVWDIFEVHREDLKEDGSKIFTHVHKDDFDELKLSIEKSKKNLSEWNQEFRVVLSKGTRWLRGKSRPERLSDGSVLWYGYVTDITEHKEMEIEMQKRAETISKELGELEVANLKLKENRESILGLMTDMAKTKKSLEVDDVKMKTIISSMGEGLIIVNRQYKISLINPKALELLGYQSGEVEGKSLFEIMKIIRGKKELLIEDWPTEESFTKNKIISSSLEDEIYIKTDKLNNQKAVTFSSSPLLEYEKEKDCNNKDIVIVIHDANKDRELDMAKSGFISTASHQLRTPLTTIRWYSEMLLSGSYGVLSEAQHDLVNEIHGGVNRLYQTINLLLGISRIESGKIGNDRVPIDLTAITTEVIKELTPSMVEKKLVYFSFSAQTDPVFVVLDPVTLRQVILNLYANAIRYTNSKGTIEGRWLEDKEKSEVIYSVRDNGIGIPKTAWPHVFTKFFRADNAISKSPDGTGLGLAFVKDIVTSWGGRVWFETEEGKGTTFFFTIPTYKA